MAEPSAEPVDVEVEGPRGLTIRWDDGHLSHFEADVLRASCPCAECRNLRDRDLPVWPKPGHAAAISADGAELVGNWGLNIRWSDGHHTGISPWTLLREWG